MSSPYQLDDRGVVVSCPQCGQRNRLPYGHLGDTVRCPVCKNEIPAPSAPIEVPTVHLFDVLTGQSALPVVVDYWAAWCGPCRMVAPELVKIAAQQAGRWIIAKVDTEQLPELATRYEIQSIPMMSVFHKGREKGRTVGARPARDILAFVEQSLAA